MDSRTEQLREKRHELLNRKADLQFQLDSVAAELRSVEAEIGDDPKDEAPENTNVMQHAVHGGRFHKP